MLARRLVELADQQEIGIQKVANDAAKRDELGAVAQPELDAALLSRVLLENREQAVPRGARKHGTRQDNRVTAGLLRQRFANFAEREGRILQGEGAAVVARRRNDHEGELGFAHRFLMAHRRAKPVAGLLDERLKARLLDWCAPGLQGLHGSRVDVDTDHVVAAAGDCRRHARAELAEPYDREPSTHATLSSSPTLIGCTAVTAGSTTKHPNVCSLPSELTRSSRRAASM